MMKKLLIVFFSCYCWGALAQQPAGQYVIMLSLDGFRADYPEKYQVQNLLAIAKQGVRIKRMIPSNPTKTFPNHYTLVTGLYPDHHGLIGNTFYAPDLDKTYQLSDRESVENGDFYGGEPIWNTAHKANLQTASYFWVGSEATVQKMQPDKWKRYNNDISFEARIDSVISWLQLPFIERPRLITMYYHEPDKAGHHYGPNSLKVREQVCYVDEQVGDLYRKLMQLPIADSINLIIVSDHGMREITSKKQIVLADYLKKDWVKGIYGTNPVYTINAVPDKKDSIYKALRKIPHIKVFKMGRAFRRWKIGSNIRMGDFFIVGKIGWSVFTHHQKRPDIAGTHGYLNNDKQMSALFIAKGAALKEGYTQRTIRNVDVYNLVAEILGIQPAPNDGEFRRVRRLLKKK